MVMSGPVKPSGLEKLLVDAGSALARLFGANSPDNMAAAYRELDREYRRVGLQAHKMTPTEDFPYGRNLALNYPGDNPRYIKETKHGIHLTFDGPSEELIAEAHLIADTCSAVAKRHGLKALYTAPDFDCGGALRMYVGFADHEPE